MNEVTLRDFRCFHEEQTARLAPLTLLVGENSTGKTSFLAMLRVLAESASRGRVADFQKAPYDLGSFDDIVHYRGASGGKADTFGAGFTATRKAARRGKGDGAPYRYRIAFRKQGAMPVPLQVHFSKGKTSLTKRYEANRDSVLTVRTRRGAWHGNIGAMRGVDFAQYDLDFALLLALKQDRRIKPLDGSPPITKKDWESLKALAERIPFVVLDLPFASAPVRSKPRRTYDPGSPIQDPEGNYIPMYLWDMSVQHKKDWLRFKEQLERFGKNSGLFDEIFIRPLGDKDSDPFQVQVSKSGGQRRGTRRNLTDVGYGVSQVLPVITELLRPDASSLHLLQQPEVHLHPSAQAALGTLFCQVATKDRQLIVETHSDHLLDRVRMDVRDGATQLKARDVSILFFERQSALDVKIHSLRLDEQGDVRDAPEGYRSFFMEEIQRSLGI